MEITTKTNRYAESIVENIVQRFPSKSVTALTNAFEIFNFELFPTSLSFNQFKCFDLSEIEILATHYKIDEVLKKEWCSFHFELKEIKTKWLEFKQNVE